MAPSGNLGPPALLFSRVPLGTQVVWLVLLAIPVATVAWTVTHEEIFKEPRNFCARQSQTNRRLFWRKFFFLFTCEFCFSFYVSAFFLWLTRYKLLLDDWRGYLMAQFALMWAANQYMSLYARLRLDIRKERVEIKKVEQTVDAREESRKAA